MNEHSRNPGTSLIPFDFEGKSVRVTDRNGNPWFVLADICRILELDNPSKAAMGLDEDEKMTLTNMEGHSRGRGGAQSWVVVSESGAYALTFKSRKPEAKRLRRFVTEKVLPSIRKTGSYSIHRDGDLGSINTAAIVAAVKEAAPIAFREMLPQILPDIMDALLPKLTEQVIEARIAADKRVAVLNFRPTLEIMKERGIEQAGRRGVITSMTSSLKDYCLKEGVNAERCPHSGKWLFPSEIVPKWWRTTGQFKLQELLAKRAKAAQKPEEPPAQGTLKLVVKNEKPKKGGAA